MARSDWDIESLFIDIGMGPMEFPLEETLVSQLDNGMSGDTSLKLDIPDGQPVVVGGKTFYRSANPTSLGARGIEGEIWLHLRKEDLEDSSGDIDAFGGLLLSAYSGAVSAADLLSIFVGDNSMDEALPLSLPSVAFFDEENAVLVSPVFPESIGVFFGAAQQTEPDFMEYLVFSPAPGSPEEVLLRYEFFAAPEAGEGSVVTKYRYGGRLFRDGVQMGPAIVCTVDLEAISSAIGASIAAIPSFLSDVFSEGRQFGMFAGIQAISPTAAFTIDDLRISSVEDGYMWETGDIAVVDTTPAWSQILGIAGGTLELTITNDVRNDDFTLPINQINSAIILVDWGDGSETESFSNSDVINGATHTYDGSGEYTITVQGAFPSLTTEDLPQPERDMILSIDAWDDDIGLQSISLKDAINLTSVPDSLPSTVWSLDRAFEGCASFNSANVLSWNVQGVNTFVDTFSGAASFNQDIAQWDFTFPNDMTGFLDNCGLEQSNYEAFLLKLNTYVAPSFLYLSGSSEFSMSTLGAEGMTYDALDEAKRARLNLIAFGGLNIVGDELADVESVVFEYSDLGNNEQVKLPLVGQFTGTVDWGDGNVDSYSAERWAISESEPNSPTHTYAGTPEPRTITVTGFLQDFKSSTLGSLDSNSYLSGFFGGISTIAGVNRDLLIFDAIDGIDSLVEVSSWGNKFGLTSLKLSRAENLLDVPDSLPPTVLILNQAFQFCSSFDSSSVAAWDTTNVIDTKQAFDGATTFNQDLSGWTVVRALTMTAMFRGASAFDQDISGWDVGAVIDFASMFQNATSFNQDIGGWTVSSATTMENMFDGALVFNQDLGSWDVSNVTRMNSMFQVALAFNNGGSASIQSWNTSNVTEMGGMFSNAAAFNQPIGTGSEHWDTSNVQDMFGVFSGAAAYSQDMDQWDTSSAFSLAAMFNGATAFTGNGLASWDTSNVTQMGQMFTGATLFDQDLSNWDFTSLSGAIGLVGFLNDSGMTVANVNSLFTTWDAQKGSMPIMSNVGLENVPEPTGGGATARASLEGDGWTFAF